MIRLGGSAVVEYGSMDYGYYSKRIVALFSLRSGFSVCMTRLGKAAVVP